MLGTVPDSLYTLFKLTHIMIGRKTYAVGGGGFYYYFMSEELSLTEFRQSCPGFYS